MAFAKQLADAISAYARRRDVAVEIEMGRTITLRPSEALPLDYLAGTHRIQRIPPNGGGRRHTSTATIAFLDATAAATIELADDDLLVQAYRGSGPGGQNRNKVATAIRLTHVPTGITVCAERERSQWQNLQAAKAALVRELEDVATRTADQEQNRDRVQQIASGERSVKQWTWNDQRGEVMDHATGKVYVMRQCLRGRF